uniref:Uncharacterized protein n=1 Tax=Bos taurus TaxID=9913 RepID=A0ABI0NRJ8_BOVIN
MAAAAETGQAVARSGKRRRGHRRLASEPQTLARLAAGPWLPGALTCPQRTRGDAVTRSARPPVLPPPPRPPQRRCRHLVSRAGTPRCACAGTASEGLRRCRAAILSVAGPAGSLDPACFGPPPFLPCPSLLFQTGLRDGRQLCRPWGVD